MKFLSLLIAMIVALIFSSVGMATKPNYCGELKGYHYGPFDYINRHSLSDELYLVEIGHFTPNVENLVSGNTGPLAGELDYTLRAWPNHHRALISLARLSARDKSTRFPGLKWPVECYFDRAIRMNAADAKVRSIYGSYLSHHGRNKEAIEQLEISAKLEPDNVTALYNLGLLYFKQKKYEKANYYAQRVYKLNFPLPGLKKKLIQVGKWKVSTQPAKVEDD